MKRSDTNGLRLGRREILSLGAGAFVVGLLPLASRRRSQRVQRTVPVMGTVAELVVLDADHVRARRGIDAAIEALRDVERRMSRFLPDSDVGRANGHAFTQSVAISAPTVAVLTEALRWADASDGAFDPCLGRAVTLWDAGSRTAPPAADDVRSLARRHLHRSLELDARAGSVRFLDPDVALDLGGIAKGYGVDQAVAALREHGIEKALVNVGGDLFALGTAEDGRAWRVGIRSPKRADEMVGTVDLVDQAVATSGDYEQAFLHEGRRYHHLLDPESGEPRRASERSLTVVASDCLRADAAATALFGLPDARAQRILATCAPGARLIRAA